MQYIINHQITFCNESRTLSLLNNVENSLILSAPAARLLLVLITNRNSPLTREYLLTTVWEDYGFTASGSNLNNYISELRKSFAHLEPNFAGIITIPKVGFQFTANIETLLPQNNQTESLLSLQVTHPIVPSSDNNIGNNNASALAPLLTQSTISKTKNKKWRDKGIFVAAILTLPIVIIAIYYLLSHQHEAPTENYKLIFKQGNCDIYSLDEFTSLSNNEIIKSMKEDLDNKYLDCNTNNQYDIYYSYLPKSNSTLSSTEFIGVCIKNENKENSYKNCYSIYHKAE